MKKDATAEILANPGFADFPLAYTPSALDKIYDLTHGQPYLVQLLGFQLVRLYNDFVFENGRERNATFTESDVEAVINNPDFFQRGRGYFDGVWGQASEGARGQQDILRAIAPHPDGLTDEELAQLCTATQDALDTLKQHDVIAQVSGKWRMVVELFRRWVVQL